MSEQTTGKADETVAAGKATRQVRQKGRLVIGVWELSRFEAMLQQPEPEITDLREMIAWASKELAKKPGTYELVRAVPGNLVIESVQRTRTRMEPA